MTHYFHSPEGEGRRRSFDCRIWGRDYTFTASDGVFSGSRLDLGTSVLFREVPPPREASRLLDLGCGVGPIAVALATECPRAIVDAVDVNERALALTCLNARTAGVDERVRAFRPADWDDAVRYDEIWSNPPIRVGKKALQGMLSTWLPRLNHGGRAVLVVGRNLGADSLQRWLTDQDWPCEKLASAKGFRVLQATLAQSS